MKKKKEKKYELGKSNGLLGQSPGLGGGASLSGPSPTASFPERAAVLIG